MELMFMILLLSFSFFALTFSAISLVLSIKLHIKYHVFMGSTQSVSVPALAPTNLDTLTNELFKSSGADFGYTSPDSVSTGNVDSKEVPQMRNGAYNSILPPEDLV